MKQKFLSILLSRYLVALFLSLFVIFVLPETFDKYKIEIIDQDSFSGNQTLHFYDLDNDGWSEQIRAFHNTSGFAALNIFNKDGVLLDQWNFDGKFPNAVFNILSFDENGNGQKEIYLITRSQDSIFLNVVEPFGKDKFQLNNIYIDNLLPYNNTYYLSTLIHNKHIENTSYNLPLTELTFTLNSGFLGDIRNFYRYNAETNSIKKSPHLTNSSSLSEAFDLDNDGKKEYIINVSSFCNSIDKKYTSRSDCSSWLTVLNEDLNFKFDPIEFDRPFSSIQSYGCKVNGSPQIISLIKFGDFVNHPTQLKLFSSDGELLKTKIINLNTKSLGFKKISDELFVILNQTTGNLRYYNSDLNLVKVVTIGNMNKLFNIDLDNDELKEWLKIYDSDNSVELISNDFSTNLPVLLGNKINSKVFYGIKQRGNLKPHFYLQSGQNITYYEYKFNGWYFLKYVVFLSVYLAVLLILTLVIKGYKIEEGKKQKIQNKIAELQLKTIKNQVDPHFVFNAINTISELTLMDNKLESDKFICRFSDFMRETLKHSDKISTSLEEEIQYTENFIKLQQIRYNYNFDYIIDVDSSVDQLIKVPKHVLFCFVENAIKHGLSLKKDGLLKVEIYYSNLRNLVLAIEDNGGGVSLNSNTKNSTGSGLSIMSQIFDLYTQLTNKKIEQSIVQLKSEDGKVLGLRIEIIVHKKNK